MTVEGEDLTALSDMQLDVLQEIGNVGAGNSATALSRLIKHRIEMNVPRVALVPIEDVPEFVGGPELVVVGIFLRVYGKAPSNILFLIPRDSAFALADTMCGREVGMTTELSPMDESALMEVGNILAGSYLNAFYSFTGISMLPSVPALAVDMAGAILNVVLVQLGEMGDHALLIETNFVADDHSIKGHFFLVPDTGSLSSIMNAVGVGGYAEFDQSRHGRLQGRCGSRHTHQLWTGVLHRSFTIRPKGESGWTAPLYAAGQQAGTPLRHTGKVH